MSEPTIQIRRSEGSIITDLIPSDDAHFKQGALILSNFKRDIHQSLALRGKTQCRDFNLKCLINLELGFFFKVTPDDRNFIKTVDIAVSEVLKFFNIPKRNLGMLTCYKRGIKNPTSLKEYIYVKVEEDLQSTTKFYIQDFNLDSNRS